DFLGHRARRFFVTREVHRVRGATLGAGTHVRGVSEHFRQRHDGANHLRTGAVLHAFNAPATRTQIAHDGARKILGDDHFHRHDRLKQHGAGFTRGFLEGHGTGDLECHFARVHLVVAAVVERRLNVHHFVAGKNAAFERLANALIHGLDVFLGHDAANDVVHELVAFARGLRLEANLYVTVLAATAGLTNELAFGFGGPADGLAIGDLRLAHVGLDGELAHHAVNDDFQVQLTHAADDGLSAVGIS